MHSSIKYSFTRDMFIQRVEQVIGRQLTKSELGTLVGNVLDFDQEMFDDYKERGWLDGKSSRKFLEFHPIEQVPDRVSGKEWDFGYWLYDKKTKIFICNLRLGVHEVLTGTLYNIYQNSEYNDYETGAEGASMDVMRKFYYAWHKELDEANLVEIGGTAGEFKFIVERL